LKKKIENFAFWIAAFVFGVALIIVYKTFDNFGDVLGSIAKVVSAMKPFFVAFIIAYIVNLPKKKIYEFLQKRKNKFVVAHSLGISVLLAYIVTAGVLVIVVGALFPAIYKNLLDFYLNIDTYFMSAKEYIKNIEIFRRFDILQDIDKYNISGGISTVLQQIDGTQIGKYISGVFNATSGIFSAFISLIASVYMLVEKESIAEGCKKIIKVFVKENYVDDIMRYMHQINEIFTSYVYSRLICCIVMGCVCSFVLSVMKVKYALALGMFIGLCDLIPYFGSIVATTIAILINLLTSGIWSSVWVAVVLIILQQIDGNILAPKIMGKRLELSSLATIFAVVVGGNLFGFLGMVFTVPIVAIARVIIGDLMKHMQNKKAGL